MEEKKNKNDSNEYNNDEEDNIWKEGRKKIEMIQKKMKMIMKNINKRSKKKIEMI